MRKSIVVVSVVSAIGIAITSVAMSGRSLVVSEPHVSSSGSSSESNDRSRVDEKLVNIVSSNIKAGNGGASLTVEDIVASRNNIFQSFNELVDLSKSGNSKAAYQLYLDMYQCRSLDARNEMLEQVAASHDSGTLDRNAIDQITSSAAACEGVTDEMLEDMTDWLILSARMGNTEAKVDFLGAVLSKYSNAEEMISKADEISQLKSEGIKHLRDAVSHGSVRALSELAHVYRDGIAVGRDHVLAYAYMLALERTGTSKLAGTALEVWGRELKNEDITRANDMADEIYIACCLNR